MWELKIEHRSFDFVNYVADKCNEQSRLVFVSRMIAIVGYSAIDLETGGPKPKQDQFEGILWWVSSGNVTSRL